jgi:hypothetical protein
MDDTARLLAVEVLLADPETLGNDALETDLYILRDRLRGTPRRRARKPVSGNPVPRAPAPACEH